MQINCICAVYLSAAIKCYPKTCRMTSEYDEVINKNKVKYNFWQVPAAPVKV